MYDRVITKKNLYGCFLAQEPSQCKKVKEHIAVNGFPSHTYGMSLAIWDHTVLPARLLPNTSEHAPP